MNAKNILIALLAVVLIAGGAFYLNKDTNKTTFDVAALLTENSLVELYEKDNILIINQGSATVTRADGNKETITKNTTVKVNDKIVIAKDSSATLNWFDGSVSRLQAETELTITKAKYNPDNISQTNINFNVASGEVWSKVANLVNEDSEFLSYGGAVVAGVRGSAYNFVVKNGDVKVASYEHAAFIAKVDPKTNEVIQDSETIIVSGEQAIITDEVIVEEIPEEKLKSKWTKDNTLRDKKVTERIQKRNLERIKKIAGPLPGQEGYEKKQKAIQKYLNKIKDPEKRAKADARVAKLQAREVVAIAISGGPVADVAIQIQRAKAKIEASELSDTEKIKIKNQLQSEVEAMDRALSTVLADNQDMYKIKEALRKQRIELEDNAEKKERIKEKIAERKIYEVSDLIKKDGVKTEIIDSQLKNLDKDIESIKDSLENRPNIQKIKEKFDIQIDKKLEDKIEAGEIDIKKAEEIQKRVEIKKDNVEKKLKDKAEAIREKLQETNKINKVIPSKPAIKENKEETKEPETSEHIESAKERSKRIQDRIDAARKKRLKAQPAPTPNVIKNSPAHQGESNM